jgi:hypothetical protein
MDHDCEFQPTIAEDAAGDATAPLCEQCSQPFNRRKASGDKPQRFCSAECRMAFHSENRNVPQRAPTCSGVSEAAVTSGLAHPAAAHPTLCGMRSAPR